MQQIVLIIHFLIAIFLIVVVLIQRGKGASMGAAFGSGASTTVFGSKGSVGFLLKLTVGLGILFFATSIFLTYLSAKEAKQASTTNNILTNVETLSKIIQDKQPAAQPGTVLPNNQAQPLKTTTQGAVDQTKPAADQAKSSKTKSR